MLSVSKPLLSNTWNPPRGLKTSLPTQFWKIHASGKNGFGFVCNRLYDNFFFKIKSTYWVKFDPAPFLKYMCFSKGKFGRDVQNMSILFKKCMFYTVDIWKKVTPRPNSQWSLRDSNYYAFKMYLILQFVSWNHLQWVTFCGASKILAGWSISKPLWTLAFLLQR